jgi:hypothetical protein
MNFIHLSKVSCIIFYISSMIFRSYVGIAGDLMAGLILKISMENILVVL